MRWTSADIEKYKQSAEYVDTAVVPLLPIDLGMGMKESAGMCDFITVLASQLERQLQGRLVLLPGIAYLKGEEEDGLEMLGKIHSGLSGNQVKHVFYVTSDYWWKQNEVKMAGDVIWLPSLPLDQMDEQARAAVLEDQVRQLMNLFIQKWRENE